MKRRSSKSKYKRPTSKCPSGKKWHRDKVSAEISKMKTNNFIEATGADRETPKRSYKCNMCSGWHLTSRPQKTERVA